MTKADLQADNGIIHFVTDVIFPEVAEDIPAKLASDGRFATLLTAIEMAGLGEMLTNSKSKVNVTPKIRPFISHKRKFIAIISPA